MSGVQLTFPGCLLVTCFTVERMISLAELVRMVMGAVEVIVVPGVYGFGVLCSFNFVCSVLDSVEGTKRRLHLQIIDSEWLGVTQISQGADGVGTVAAGEYGLLVTASYIYSTYSLA